MAHVIFYMTNATGLRKTKTDIRETRYLLDAKRVIYEEVDVSLMDDDERAEMWGKSGTKTLPQVFVDDEYIGGYDELQELEEEGKLDAVLKVDQQ
ncbi:glutaredoxin 3 [Thecamonas trahens ATCC 50062]|uniref:Glutaredoxin 3 n=1 Tax=Thecamonas trahens ATCC 50062 TaxID=461836 RepID=A0A0L0DG07_THETB|nr:glutaredoxin 3 [Thecamonas trahens ATCC 50062]KNC51249.1 glutaredoxin 3 [Thecamonas trahens ATCC 50062]|eukprot:XP_013756180.1 glutaredoxin 3 [Thecamonas trahens ATCC 50062]